MTDPGPSGGSTTVIPREWELLNAAQAGDRDAFGRLVPYPDTNLGLASPAGPEARYEQRESIELAFIAALQHLPARQRAVLILRDVLGYSARETAEILETTPISIDSALQRAHKTADHRLPSQSQQRTLRLLGDEELSRLVKRYIVAWEGNDVDAIVSMLAEDARIVMPPLPSWYDGRKKIGIFLRRYPLAGVRQWRLIPSSANGQPAVGVYVRDGRPKGSGRTASTFSHCATTSSQKSPPSSTPTTSHPSASPCQSPNEPPAVLTRLWAQSRSREPGCQRRRR